MGQSDFDKRMQVRRTRGKLSANLEKLEQSKSAYIEKAKEAYKRGDTHTYALARAGLAATLKQMGRTREMLLHIEITTLMRDTGNATEEFLTGMETIFKRLKKVNKSLDIGKAQRGLRGAIAGMENVQMQLDGMLEESEETFAALGGDAYVSDAELDGLLGASAAQDEEDAAIDAMLGEALGRTQSAPAAAAEPPAHVAQTPFPASQESPAPMESSVPPKAKKTEKFASGSAGALPPLELLNDYATQDEAREENERALTEAGRAAEEVLAELGVPAKVVGRVAGATFARLEMAMPIGTSVQKAEPLMGDVALRLRTSVRFCERIEGKDAFGIEVPVPKRTIVGLKRLLTDETYNAGHGALRYVLGMDINGAAVASDLTRAPHVLIGGSTGSGKSCFMHSLLASLLYRYTPAELRIALIDLKRVEFAAYAGIPHLAGEIVCDDDTAFALINELCEEMERRYTLFSQIRCRHIAEYNGQSREKLPYVVAIVDEYADIATGTHGKEFETCLRQLVQKSRACGIHVVLATQRPDVKVLSGTIKANFPTQIAFKVARKEDSRTILGGRGGAESLLGNGDMLYCDAASADALRLQAPFVGAEETAKLVAWWRREGSHGTV